MKRTLMCATAAAALASAMTVANAQDGWYGRADLGYTFEGRLDSDPPQNVPFALGGNQEVSDGLINGDIGLGYGFDNGFRLETVFGYRTGDLKVDDTITGGALPPFGPNLAYQAGGSAEIDAYDLMINGLYDFNRGGVFQPYIGAGIGYAQISADATNLRAGVMTGGNLETFDANGFSDDDAALAYQALAGVGYKLSEQLTLDMGYKYFTTDGLDFDGRGPTGGPVPYEAEYQDHTVTVGLRYQFAAPAPPPPPQIGRASCRERV